MKERKRGFFMKHHVVSNTEYTYRVSQGGSKCILFPIYCTFLLIISEMSELGKQRVSE